MGALAGFRYRDIVKRLKQLGLEFHRQAAGSHEIGFNPTLNRYTNWGQISINWVLWLWRQLP